MAKAEIQLGMGFYLKNRMDRIKAKDTPSSSDLQFMYCLIDIMDRKVDIAKGVLEFFSNDIAMPKMIKDKNNKEMEECFTHLMGLLTPLPLQAAIAMRDLDRSLHSHATEDLR